MTEGCVLLIFIVQEQNLKIVTGREEEGKCLVSQTLGIPCEVRDLKSNDNLVRLK